MDNQWSLETHGDPLGKVHDFISQIWLEADLDGMLVTMNGGNEAHATPRYITDITFIDKINPFKPLMEINAARLIPDLLEIIRSKDWCIIETMRNACADRDDQACIIQLG